MELEAALDDAREHFEAGLKRVVERAQNHWRDHRNRLCRRAPRESSLFTAPKKDHFDLIIVGRRGTSLFQKMILGSVSERVLRYAHCPVMVVK